MENLTNAEIVLFGKKMENLTNAKIVNIVTEIYWGHTGEGDSFGTADSGHKTGYTIIDDQTVVTKYFVHNNADKTFEEFGEIEDAVASIPRKVLIETIEYYGIGF